MICSDFCNVELAIVPFAFYHSSIKQAVGVNIFLVFLDLFNKQKFLLFSNMLWFIFATKVQHVMCCFSVITLYNKNKFEFKTLKILWRSGVGDEMYYLVIRFCRPSISIWTPKGTLELQDLSFKNTVIENWCIIKSVGVLRQLNDSRTQLEELWANRKMKLDLCLQLRLFERDALEVFS